MTDSLKLPEKSRAALAELYRAVQQAQKDFQGPLLVALDFLGLDPMLNHQINFDTGVVTPAAEPSALSEPTPIRDDAVAG